jgi:hypothetical protein
VSAYIEKKELQPGCSLTCRQCRIATLFDPDYTVGGKDAHSVATHMAMYGTPLGWSVEVVGGEAQFICPACTGGAYDGKAKCPKCGHDDIGTRHCLGTPEVCNRGINREHLHRSCGLCGYNWLQETQDAAMKPEVKQPSLPVRRVPILGEAISAPVLVSLVGAPPA